MELKEEIEKRIKIGYKKEEIISYLISKGYSKEEIENNLPKFNRSSLNYKVVLVISVIISLPLLATILTFSTMGIIGMAYCYGTFLIFKLKRLGFTIHIVFYGLLILSWLIGFLFFRENTLLTPIFKFKYFIPLVSFSSFMITSLINLQKKL